MTLEEIKKVIETAVPDSKVYVLDPMNDGQHLQAVVVSAAFENKPLVRQHQMVMQPLKQAFTETVHALGLKTFTPEKWAGVKDQYGLD